MTALEYSTDQKAEVVGKPEASFFLEAVEEFGCDAARCVMIGDVSTHWGDWVAQWLQHRTQGPKDEGSNPVRSTGANSELCQVKNVVLTRRRCVQPPCVCAPAYKNAHVRTLKILSSVSEFGGFRKHEKTEHAPKNNS